jgi:RimJ/RimL family protein N-acetyltransferase
VPPGPKALAFIVWWLFHAFRVFSNRDYSALIVLRNGYPVHRSCVFPRYFRYPFMSATDLQIGDTWTCPSERGKGLATFALKAIAECHRVPGRELWYLVDEQNQPSIRVAENAGFSASGFGCRTRLFGVRILGQYVLTKRSR